MPLITGKRTDSRHHEIAAVFKYTHVRTGRYAKTQDILYAYVYIWNGLNALNGKLVGT